MGLYDTIMCFSSELLAAHADNFTEYALTLGKQSQGLNTFRGNVLALVDKSKQLAANPANKLASDNIQASRAIFVHGQMHERSIQLAQQLAGDLNADYAALYSEKKYRELQ